MNKPMRPLQPQFFTYFLSYQKAACFWMLIGIFCLCSCEEAEPIPIVGTYIGTTTTETWGFEEIFDTNGNMIGIKQTQDTVITQGDLFTITQGDNSNTFRISGSGGLTRLNSFSSRDFSYQSQHAFSLVEETNGLETLRLEFSFDGAGNTNLMLWSSSPDNNNNRPPVKEQLIFSGVVN